VLALPAVPDGSEVARVLDALGARWARSDTLVSTCPCRGPCGAHPDRGERCSGARGVTYLVQDGILSGHWVGWGSGADASILGAMTERLEVAWRTGLRSYGEAARALRSVGR